MRAAAVALALALGGAAGAQTGALAGRVTDAETGAAVPGAAVLVLLDAPRPLGRAADADGRYRIENVPAGEHGVRVRAVGYAALDARVRVRAGGTTAFDAALRPTVTESAGVVVQARRQATATRADAPTLLVPQAVTVLPPSILDGQNVRDLDRALRNVPGAAVAARGEPVGVPVLRGFETDQTGGGVRRNGVETPYLVDGLAANVERVEVLRGPASVLYGRLEPGGVVNFITEVPGGERRLEAEAEAGTLGSGRLALDVGGPAGALAARVNAAAERDGSVRDGVSQSALLLAPAVRWRPSPRLTLDADVEATASDAAFDPGLAVVAGDGPDVGAAADAVPVGTFYGEPDARVRSRSLGLFTAADLALGASASLRSTASLARYDFVRDGLALDSLVRQPGGPAVARSLRRESLGFTYLKGAVFLDARLQTGPVSHAVTVGAEAVRAWAQAEGSAPLVGRGDGVQFAAIGAVALDGPEPAGLPGERVRYLQASVRGVDAGLFVQDRATVRVGGGRLHAVGSARVSHVTAEADIFALADTPDAPAGVSARRFAVWAVTPAAGLVAEVRPGLALYASGGTSFNPTVERVDRDGQPFRPTRGIQAEGGAKLDALGGRLGAALAAFWIRKDDALTQGPGGFFEQTGRQRSRGVEAEARGSTGGLTVLAHYALLDAEVVEDDNLAPGTPLPYAPRHSASAWAEWRLGARWTVRGGVWAQGERRGSTGTDLRLPARATVDVGAEAALAGGVRLRLDVRNALGARGYTSATARRGLDGGRLLAVWPGPGREVRLGLVVRR